VRAFSGVEPQPLSIRRSQRLREPEVDDGRKVEIGYRSGRMAAQGLACRNGLDAFKIVSRYGPASPRIPTGASKRRYFSRCTLAFDVVVAAFRFNHW
jgi:hypothetical protein